MYFLSPFIVSASIVLTLHMFSIMKQNKCISHTVSDPLTPKHPLSSILDYKKTVFSVFKKKKNAQFLTCTYRHALVNTNPTYCTYCI